MKRRSFLGFMAAVPLVGVNPVFRKKGSILTEWIDVMFENGWDNATGLGTVQFKKDLCGRIWLKGTAFLEIIQEPDAEPLPPIDPALFTLPIGYRPSEKMMIPCPLSNQLINSPMYIDIDGVVSIPFGGGIAGSLFVSFESISYSAA